MHAKRPGRHGREGARVSCRAGTLPRSRRRSRETRPRTQARRSRSLGASARHPARHLTPSQLHARAVPRGVEGGGGIRVLRPPDADADAIRAPVRGLRRRGRRRPAKRRRPSRRARRVDGRDVHDIPVVLRVEKQGYAAAEQQGRGRQRPVQRRARHPRRPRTGTDAPRGVLRRKGQNFQARDVHR